MGPGAALKNPIEEADAALLTPLGEFMQRRNAELGLSVAAVSQRAGMSRATWYRIARGESASPGLRVLRGLARIYKVRAAELFALAAYADAPAPAPRNQPAGPAPETGDALWRCQYERQVRPGTRLDIQLALRNLSDRPWLGAEVRGVHDRWLPLGDGHARAPQACGAGNGLPSCCAALAPTAPGEWVQACLTLRAPLTLGPCVFCLMLHTDASAPAPGAGVYLFIETH